MTLLLPVPASGAPDRKLRSALFAVLFVVLGCLDAARAGEWTFTPRVATTATLTDNVALVEEDRDADFVFQVTPGISASGQGRRLRANVDASLTRFAYLDNSQFNRNTSQFLVDSQFVAIENWLSFEGTLSRSQQVIARGNGPLPTSLANVAGNVAEISNYRFGPTLEHTFGPLGTLNLSWRHSLTRARQDDILPSIDDSDGNLIPNTDDDVYNARFTTGRFLPRLPVTLSHSVRESRFEAGGSDRIQSSSVATSYAISRRFSVNGSVGYDDNDLRGEVLQANQGFFWQSGFAFTPNDRTRFGVNYGRRFFGENLNVDASWVRRRFALQALYTTNITTFSSRQEAVQLFDTTDAFGRPVVNPLAGINPRLVTENVSLVNSVAVSRNLSLNAEYRLRRDTLRLAVARNRLEAQDIGSQSVETASTFSLNWERQLAPGASFAFSARYLESSFGAAGLGANRVTTLGPSFNYRLAERLTSSLRYSYTDSTGGIELQQFTENQITGILSLTF